MRPLAIQVIGEELAVRWENGVEAYIRLEEMRRHCPCAGCQGETDIMGQVHKGPEKALTARSFQILRIVNVGGYAIQPIWGDGHATGIYSFEYLQRLGGQG